MMARSSSPSMSNFERLLEFAIFPFNGRISWEFSGADFGEIKWGEFIAGTGPLATPGKVSCKL